MLWNKIYWYKNFHPKNKEITKIPVLIKHDIKSEIKKKILTNKKKFFLLLNFILRRKKNVEYQKITISKMWPYFKEFLIFENENKNKNSKFLL